MENVHRTLFYNNYNCMECRAYDVHMTHPTITDKAIIIELSPQNVF